MSEKDLPEALKHAEWLGRSLTIGAKEAAAELRRLSQENAELKERIFRLEEALKKSPGQTDQIPSDSPTAGMNLGARVEHVGGRRNAAGYIEFGSMMAVDALIRHIIRDLPETQYNTQQYTTGHCKERSKPGGCQLHNLHCGYPQCDRKQVS